VTFSANVRDFIFAYGDGVRARSAAELDGLALRLEAPHQLTADELRAGCVVYGSILRGPVVSAEYPSFLPPNRALFWAWLARIVEYHANHTDPRLDSADAKLMRTCVRALLAHTEILVARQNQSFGMAYDPNEALEFRAESIGLPHTFALGNSGILLAAHLGLPMLEALAKRYCATVIRADGTVLAAFDVPSARRPGTRRRYIPNERCSNLRDLLHLVDQRASVDLADPLREFRYEFSRVWGRSVFDMIFEWRNMALHGEDSAMQVAETLLGLGGLITLELLGAELNVAIQALNDRFSANWDSRRTGRSPWDFYLPGDLALVRR
jgi:hypothetical protein